MQRIYIVVRDFEDGAELDLSAVGWSEARALEKAKEADAKSPTWASLYPVLRVDRFVLAEDASPTGNTVNIFCGPVYSLTQSDG